MRSVSSPAHTYPPGLQSAFENSQKGVSPPSPTVQVALWPICPLRTPFTQRDRQTLPSVLVQSSSHRAPGGGTDSGQSGHAPLAAYQANHTGHQCMYWSGTKPVSVSGFWDVCIACLFWKDAAASSRPNTNSACYTWAWSTAACCCTVQ